jgi:cell division protein FtsI (penicillin-binding protein 3)
VSPAERIEGRSRRIKLAHATLALFALAILVKAASVQLLEGKDWRVRAERQQTTARTIPAPRGEILDATRHLLAQSREMVRLEIAPREVTDPFTLRRALIKLHVDPHFVARAVNSRERYLTIPGRFLAVDAAAVTSLRGVHSFATITRGYAASTGAQSIIGHVDQDNNAIDGLELSLDSILRGVPGTSTIYKDFRGRSRESPIAPSTAPISGNSVVLTINSDLQEIAEKALGDAVLRMGAEGGDIVILDPHSGDVLAMASRRLDPRQTSATPLTDPFEPGSTAKPFLAAGLLERGKVRDADSVDTGNGVLEVNGREIHDEHLIGRAPLADVLRWSSNIGIVKFSQRLSEREEFETLRDFGFGMPTGLPFPSESNGVLRPPKSWSVQSANSLAMGYELSVTPLQLALAYAPFANGGELVEPALVKEVIAPDGTVRYRHRRRVVRRVMSKAVADKVRRMLLDVVDEGTALKAALDNYLLAGKTGTPRGTVRGRYVTGRYNPNFVGIFPGDVPQYVIVVKLTAPQSAIYAAETAAPVSKVILQAALAARDAALDRSKLAVSAAPARRDSVWRSPIVQAVHAEGEVGPAVGSEAPNRSGTVPYVVTLPLRRAAARLLPPRAIPDIRGLTLRDAVHSLHSAGFRVQLAPSAPSAPSAEAGYLATAPSAGMLAPIGALVRLHFSN